MKRAITYLLFLFISYSSFSQVGIGTTDPKAQLDISAGSTPSEKDGILIPRLDEFPAGVGTDQDGMLLFITGNGTPTKGFYYWDNDTTAWITVGNSDVEKIDDLSDGKSDNLGSSLFLGLGSGSNDDGSDNRNIAIGFEALPNNTTGGANTAIGYKTMTENTTGIGNIALGAYTLTSNSIGNFNIANGFNSLGGNLSGEHNIGVGRMTLAANTTGDYNSAFGSFALLGHETGDFNTAIGPYSLRFNLTGSNNVGLGSFSGINNDGSANIFLGYYSGSNETGSNKLYIENSNADADNALIYGEFDNNILRTNSEFQIGNPTGTGYAFPTTDGTSGQVLSTDGNGQLNFITLEDNGYDFPTTDGTAGQVLSTDGNGQISFTTLEDDADWYEEGTTTAPNSITDNIYTQGNVSIEGQAYISSKMGIGTGAENPDGYLEVRANNTATQPNINLVDIGSSGARINFSNTTTTNGNTWTLFGDTNDSSSSSLFHLFHTTTGNILTAKGDGDVGIKGTPDTDFHIFHGNSGTADGFKLQNSTDNTWWRFYVSSGTDDLRLYNSNNGTTMMGAFNDATGAYTSTSDRRLKKDFKTLHFSWNTFMQLNPLTYKYKKDSNPTNYIGMVAQDVEKIYPELVSYKVKEDIYHMDYAATGVVAIKALQELKKEVTLLEEKIENLATENTKLKVQLSKYESIESRLIALEKLDN